MANALMAKQVIWFKLKEQKGGRGRPKLILVKVVKKIDIFIKVTKSMILDRIEWRKKKKNICSILVRFFFFFLRNNSY